MGQKLITLLGGNIEADRIVHLVFSAEGHFLISTQGNHSYSLARLAQLKLFGLDSILKPGFRFYVSKHLCPHIPVRIFQDYCSESSQRESLQTAGVRLCKLRFSLQMLSLGYPILKLLLHVIVPLVSKSTTSGGKIAVVICRRFFWNEYHPSTMNLSVVSFGFSYSAHIIVAFASYSPEIKGTIYPPENQSNLV